MLVFNAMSEVKTVPFPKRTLTAGLRRTTSDFETEPFLTRSMIFAVEIKLAAAPVSINPSRVFLVNLIDNVGAESSIRLVVVALHSASHSMKLRRAEGQSTVRVIGSPGTTEQSTELRSANVPCRASKASIALLLAKGGRSAGQILS